MLTIILKNVQTNCSAHTHCSDTLRLTQPAAKNVVYIPCEVTPERRRKRKVRNGCTFGLCVTALWQNSLPFF